MGNPQPPWKYSTPPLLPLSQPVTPTLFGKNGKTWDKWSWHLQWIHGWQFLCLQKQNSILCNWPIYAIEQVNRVMKTLGGLKGLTQNPISHGKVVFSLSWTKSSRQWSWKVGKSMWIKFYSTPWLNNFFLEHYEHNVEKLRETMKINNPFLVAEEELVNIMTRAIMPDQVKEALMRADIIRQELFPKFVRERLVDRTINLWSLG